MGGLFSVVSKEDCVKSLYYGTDYHCHLGTMRGGLTVRNKEGFNQRRIHDITNSQFRSKFELDIKNFEGQMGIGTISNDDDQPVIIESHLGNYAIATVGKINNLDELKKKAFTQKGMHFAEVRGGNTSPTEMAATLIDQQDNFEEGIASAQEQIKGSCSMVVLTKKGVYAARDRLGRTPVIIGKREDGYAATSETCAFPNLSYKTEKELGPGEVVLMTPDGCEQKKKPGDIMQICSFLWVYYGYPASSYEGINVEASRYRCGSALAKADDIKKSDNLFVGGVPDSGTAHALGYAEKAKIRYRRPFVKFTPTWSRSFMPQTQDMRNLVGKMKLIPIEELIKGNRLLFCEDSIVRGTQLQDTVKRLFEFGAKEAHMRPACPPLTYGCKFLNFSTSKSDMDLATRKAIRDLTGDENPSPEELEKYSEFGSDEYNAMVNKIGDKLGLNSLRFQNLEDMVEAIGLPKEKLCTHCWDRSSYF